MGMTQRAAVAPPARWYGTPNWYGLAVAADEPWRGSFGLTGDWTGMTSYQGDNNIGQMLALTSARVAKP